MADNDKPPVPPQTPQHPAASPDAAGSAVGAPNRPVQPLKNTTEGRPSDAAANVADPAVDRRTNPGPGANRDRPSLPGPAPQAGAGTIASRNMPNQPVIPAPSEHVFPGPVGRPDPSRTPEERQGTADHAIYAHTLKPGHMQTGEAQAPERTSDGEPDESTAPAPIE
jgi:hypothetical protein